METTAKEVKDIRITDPDTRRIVERIRRRRGDSTASKTAANLIRERATQLEGGATLTGGVEDAPLRPRSGTPEPASSATS